MSSNQKAVDQSTVAEIEAFAAAQMVMEPQGLTAEDAKTKATRLWPTVRSVLRFVAVLPVFGPMTKQVIDLFVTAVDGWIAQEQAPSNSRLVEDQPQTNPDFKAGKDL